MRLPRKAYGDGSGPDRVAEGTRLDLLETGFAQLAEDVARAARRHEGWDSELADLSGVSRRRTGRCLIGGPVHLDTPAGRRHPYRLDPAPIQVALVWLSALATGWDHRLANLARLLDHGGGPPR